MTKSIWASKTFWVNIIALLATLSTAFGFDLGLTPETQIAVVGVVMSVANIILRLISESKVTVTGPGVQSLALVIGCTLFLGACSFNPITGLEGAQGYSGQEYFRVTFTVDENGVLQAEPKEILYVSGKENSTSKAYLEVYEKGLFMFDATGTSAFGGQEIRKDAQTGIVSEVGGVVGEAIGAFAPGVLP